MTPPKNPAMSAFYPAGLKIENLFRNYLYDDNTMITTDILLHNSPIQSHRYHLAPTGT